MVVALIALSSLSRPSLGVLARAAVAAPRWELLVVLLRVLLSGLARTARLASTLGALVVFVGAPVVGTGGLAGVAKM